MSSQTFNLTTEPWIKVVDATTNQEKMVSLIELFSHAQDYRQLAGDMAAQDLTILRLLLAILTTVYSRLDASGRPYAWLKVDERLRPTFLDKKQVGLSATDDDDEEESLPQNSEVEDAWSRTLRQTWQQLFQAGKFSPVVNQYLLQNADCFDLFGSRPFYQVTRGEYDALVPKNKQVATGNGKVGIKQINRRISESGNKKAIFSPKSGTAKNEASPAELARWIIMYQNFTGVTDKTKVDLDERNPSGWLYGMTPVFAQGDTLFETLILNLILVSQEGYAVQKPVWEYDTVQDYVAEREKKLQPRDLAALYTTWSRILYIEEDVPQRPIIFSAGLPIFAADAAFIEPMTTWNQDKKTLVFHPAEKTLYSLSKAMWRNFGLYVNVNKADTVHEPGIIKWLRYLKKRKAIPGNQVLKLKSIVLIKDGNAASQMPAVEVVDDMQINANVLLEKAWPVRIEDAISDAQAVGNNYRAFMANIAKVRHLDASDYSKRLTSQLYERFNSPFKKWLADLTDDADPDLKSLEWKKCLQRIVRESAQDVMRSSSPRDVKGLIIHPKKGDPYLMNIFIASNWLKHDVQASLYPQN